MRPPPKKLLCCPLPTDRKMWKNGVVFLVFCFCCWKCQIWAKNLLKFVFNGLKKHLYMRFDCIPAEFSPFRNFKKNIGKLSHGTKKKKKKKNRPTDPIFKFWLGEGNITIFFCWPDGKLSNRWIRPKSPSSPHPMPLLLPALSFCTFGLVFLKGY